MRIKIELDPNNVTPQEAQVLQALAKAVTGPPPGTQISYGEPDETEVPRVTVYATEDKQEEALKELQTVPGAEVESEVVPVADPAIISKAVKEKLKEVTRWSPRWFPWRTRPSSPRPSRKSSKR
jgi:hypothetical protein